MDDVLRSGRVFLRARVASVVATLVVAGCHRGDPLVGVGRATETPHLGVTVAPEKTEEVSVPSPIPVDFKSTFARLGPDSFVSFGHAAGRYASTVYVTPEAKASALRRGADVAVGTELVMVTTDGTSHKPGPTYFMHKDAPKADGGAGTWRFGIVEAPKATPQEVALCARCHAESPHDFVFALPE